MNRLREILHELKHHAPFTALATLSAILIVILIQYLIKTNISQQAFEIFHPIHIIASAIVTAGIFYKYKKNIFHASLIGIGGAIIIGSLSDILFPYAGAMIFNLSPLFHLPVFEEPILILSCALGGALIGISTGITKIPHFIHIFISTFASLFYLITFSPVINLIFFVISFAIVFIAVIVPCCLSDIAFPFFFLGKRIKSCDCKK